MVDEEPSDEEEEHGRCREVSSPFGDALAEEGIAAKHDLGVDSDEDGDRCQQWQEQEWRGAGREPGQQEGPEEDRPQESAEGAGGFEASLRFAEWRPHEHSPRHQVEDRLDREEEQMVEESFSAEGEGRGGQGISRENRLFSKGNPDVCDQKVAEEGDDMRRLQESSLHARGHASEDDGEIEKDSGAQSDIEDIQQHAA